MGFTFSEKSHIKLMLRTKLGDLSGLSFQRFFQDLMCALRPDFLDVRTHGNVGDMGADGLDLYDGNLYACYGQELANPAAIQSKFWADLESARRQRAGQFETFVFVHNDLRGVRPEVSKMLAEAQRTHADLRFTQYGFRQFLGDMIRLERDQVEMLLGCPFPTVEEVYQIGLEDLEPLLEHLGQQRRTSGQHAHAKKVPPEKLDYHQLEPEDRHELIAALKYTYQVKEYYNQRNDVLERDEVAEGFRAYYYVVREEHDDLEVIVLKLREYVAGTARRTARVEAAVWVVLAHFIETCDVFEEPPAGWQAATAEAVPS
jgi:hypothetical protein